MQTISGQSRTSDETDKSSSDTKMSASNDQRFLSVKVNHSIFVIQLPETCHRQELLNKTMAPAVL